MDSKAENQVVLIYKSGEEASDSALAAVTAAHETLKGGGVAGLENLAFKKSDAADASNANEMLKKGIATYPMLFVSVKGQGLGSPHHLHPDIYTYPPFHPPIPLPLSPSCIFLSCLSQLCCLSSFVLGRYLLVACFRSCQKMISFSFAMADRYMRKIDADKVANYIRTKLEPSSDDDVFPFNREVCSSHPSHLTQPTEPHTLPPLLFQTRFGAQGSAAV
eukprot:3054069-Rhodomonas_salina.1